MHKTGARVMNKSLWWKFAEEATQLIGNMLTSRSMRMFILFKTFVKTAGRVTGYNEVIFDNVCKSLTTGKIKERSD